MCTAHRLDPKDSSPGDHPVSTRLCGEEVGTPVASGTGQNGVPQSIYDNKRGNTLFITSWDQSLILLTKPFTPHRTGHVLVPSTTVQTDRDSSPRPSPDPSERLVRNEWNDVTRTPPVRRTTFPEGWRRKSTGLRLYPSPTVDSPEDLRLEGTSKPRTRTLDREPRPKG